jgi:hypothetical protein
MTCHGLLVTMSAQEQQAMVVVPGCLHVQFLQLQEGTTLHLKHLTLINFCTKVGALDMWEHGAHLVMVRFLRPGLCPDP